VESTKGAPKGGAHTPSVNPKAPTRPEPKTWNRKISRGTQIPSGKWAKI